MYVLELIDWEGHLVKENNKFYPNRVIFNDYEIDRIEKEVGIIWKEFYRKLRPERIRDALGYYNIGINLNLESNIRIRLRYLKKMLDLNPESTLRI